MKTLSIQRPLPSIDIRTADFLRISVNSGDVNWLPWSVLKISGLPYFASASSKASMQNSTSMVFDNRQANTFLLAQSMIATKYKKPRCIGM